MVILCLQLNLSVRRTRMTTGCGKAFLSIACAVSSSACASRPAVDRCDAVSLNRVSTRRASERTATPFGTLVFQARATEGGHPAVPSALIVVRADSVMSVITTDSVRTDASGRATFPNLAPGRYRFVARSIGRHPIVNSPVTARAGSSDTVQLLLTAAPICENWSVVPSSKQ
jgi:hypothetical protein